MFFSERILVDARNQNENRVFVQSNNVTHVAYYEGLVCGREFTVKAAQDHCVFLHFVIHAHNVSL